jgi:hypothetical protein
MSEIKLPRWAFHLGGVKCKTCMHEQLIEAEPATYGNKRIFIVETHASDCSRSTVIGLRTWEHTFGGDP